MLLVNNSTSGYYNQRLGDLHLSSTQQNQKYFLGPNASTGDPRTTFPSPPNLTTIPALQNWLTLPQTAIANGNWNKVALIPKTWAPNMETAAIYAVNGARFGVSNLVGNFGIDNGIYVWVNGRYQFGATAPGAAFPNEYPNIPLGSLKPGQNWVQILRADHGGATGSYTSITGDYNTKAIPESGEVTALLIFAAVNLLALFWHLNTCDQKSP